MLGKLLSTGFNLATLPARLTLRSVRALAMTPAQASQLLAELRDASDQAVAELQQLLASVNADKRLAAELALQAAEQHLSMAAINILRAVWLTLHSTPPLPSERAPRLMAPEPKG
jgi:DNA-binding transcriptional MerR regulator